MKLSEAIRLGAMLKGQASGALFAAGRTCAMGAALDAIGELHNVPSYAQVSKTLERVSQWFPIVLYTRKSPLSGYSNPVGVTIIALNDTMNWSREKIADWVETVEAEEDARANQLANVTQTPTPV